MCGQSRVSAATPSRLSEAPEEAVHAALTRLKGVGPWTADIYLIFSLGRADAWTFYCPHGI
jgi:DNA-3-methyladenine glycosylase II